MTAPAKRGRGRPKGSRNKSKIISGATIEHYCDIHNWNPTVFLIEVAKGQHPEFGPDDQLRANIKLHDGIHHNRGIGKVALGGELIDGQFSLVFEESPDDFALPGQTDAEGITEALREEPIQRAGDSPESR